jgi:hypothetical protein
MAILNALSMTDLQAHRNGLLEIGTTAYEFVHFKCGIDVFDMYAPFIDYLTVPLLISLAFGNNWEMFHRDV